MISVSQVHREPLEVFVRFFGGSLYLDARQSERGCTNSRPVWRWVVGSKLAERTLEQLAPYLVLKREQTVLGLAFQERRLPRGQHGADHDADARDRALMSALNHREAA